MADVEYAGVCKRYPNGVDALKEFDLMVADGEFVILVGPSGCGKSTALRILAGLDQPTSGDVRIGGRSVLRHGPGERDIAMVFQNYALYPHMSVYKNLAYGLRQRHVAKDVIRTRVDEISGILGISELLDRKPAQLSGGQRQRVAMGRALVREPQAFLLDEPLSNLDAKLRGQVRAELKRLHQRLGVTSIYVTHDQVEAMTLADRICVLNHGELQQLGTAQEVYDRPANAFVAGFMGSPPMNLVAATVVEGHVTVGGYAVCPAPTPNARALTIGIRPEGLRVVPAHQPGIPVRVDFHEPLGSHVLIHTLLKGEQLSDIDDEGLVVQAAADIRPDAGERLSLVAEPKDVHIFDAATGEAIAHGLPSRVTAS